MFKYLFSGLCKIHPYANIDKNWQYSVLCIFLCALFEVIEVDIFRSRICIMVKITLREK